MRPKAEMFISRMPKTDIPRRMSSESIRLFFAVGASPLAAHLFGWCRSEDPLGSAADAYLRFNVGAPVAAIDITRTCDEFKRILSPAFALVPAAADPYPRCHLLSLPNCPRRGA
jgi:hypothetical protein